MIYFQYLIELDKNNYWMHGAVYVGIEIPSNFQVSSLPMKEKFQCLIT